LGRAALLSARPVGAARGQEPPCVNDRLLVVRLDADD
jgi:hypothetical protein